MKKLLFLLIAVAISACSSPDPVACGNWPTFVQYPSVPERVTEVEYVGWLSFYTTVLNADTTGTWESYVRDYARWFPEFGIAFLVPDEPVAIVRSGDTADHVVLLRIHQDRFWAPWKEVCYR
jgi:hypothetical protein